MNNSLPLKRLRQANHQKSRKLGMLFAASPLKNRSYSCNNARRNWTFLGGDRGGRTAAVLYSLTGSCRHHDIDPFACLQGILSRLPSLPPGQLHELLRDLWFTSQPSARRKTAA